MLGLKKEPGKNTVETAKAVRDGLAEINKRFERDVQFEIKTPIPLGHKIAIRAIAKDEPILKYGQIIGFASEPINAGGWVHSHNVVIGTGNLDVVGLFKALREIKFPADGCVSLEYESNPKNPIDDMKQCLAAAREAIAKLS